MVTSLSQALQQEGCEFAAISGQLLCLVSASDGINNDKVGPALARIATVEIACVTIASDAGRAVTIRAHYRHVQLVIMRRCALHAVLDMVL